MLSEGGAPSTGGTLSARVASALVPALLLALFAAWSGSFVRGAGAGAAIAGHLALVLVVGWGWRSWDPLQLGTRGRALPPLLWAALLLAQRQSPVPRAGWVAVALLPLLCGLPEAVSRCWRTAERRRLGGLAISVVSGLVGLWAIVAMVGSGADRAVEPLGHHLLLGLWLAALLPLAMAPLLDHTTSPAERRVTLAACAIAVVALLATRSAAAIVAAALASAMTVPRGRRRWLLVPAALLAASLLPRLWQGVALGDVSAAARRVYWRAAWSGAGERPLLGWGPGATPWTLAPHVRPQPGVTPAGEVVGDVHSLPLQLLYELGGIGLVLAGSVVVLLLVRRLRDEAATRAVDPIRRAALAGLVGAAVALAVTPTLGTLAPWVTIAVLAGAAMAGGGDEEASPWSKKRPVRRALAWRSRAGWLYGALALALLLPLDIAHALYDLARRDALASGRDGSSARARELVAVAASLDPDHPLYRARVGWLEEDPHRRLVALAAAARLAPDLPALQLAAGSAAAEQRAQTGETGETASRRPLDEDARKALERACAGDPLDGMAPLLLAFSDPAAADAPRLGARAMLAAPALLAAVEWERQPLLLRAAGREIWRWPGVDAGYRKWLARSLARVPRAQPPAKLRRVMDTPEAPVSLFAFRRLPWRAPLASVEVRPDAVAAWSAFGLAAASDLPSTSADSFPASCSGSTPR